MAIRPHKLFSGGKVILFYLLFALSFSVAAKAQPKRFLHTGKKVEALQVWQVGDILFPLEKHPENSHAFDITFGAQFTGPDGSSKRVPGFYNGGGEYVLRFSGSRKGLWKYKTFSSLASLAGKEGSIQVTGNSDKDRHGMVTIDPRHPQYFAYEDSSSYFSLAFELDWLFALDYNDKDSLPKTSQLVSAIKQNGFKQVVMNVYAYDVGWKTESNLPAAYEYRTPAFYPFGGSNDKPDFTTLNVAFFKHFDRVIELLHQHNLVAHLMIYVWNKKVAWPAMYSAADNRYFDYIIARYQAFPNMLWDVSKEALDYGRCDIPYINERISRIRRLDAYQRLVTVHDYEYCSREPDKVDFISIQSWRSDLYSLMLEARTKHNDKPVMNIEHGGYEGGPYTSFYGNYTSPETCLIRNYQCVFAGVYSTYYWQNTSWNIVVYDPFLNERIRPKPRFDYYRHMADLFSRYDFNQLFPSKPKITTNGRVGPDNLMTSGYALSNGKDLYLYLLPEETKFTNAIVPKGEAGTIKVSYFNPFSGEWKAGGETGWTGWKDLTSPWPKTACIAVVETK